jgi:WD40 repeat protein
MVPKDFDFSDPHVGMKSHNYPAEVDALRFFADGRRLIAAYHGGDIRVWDVENGVEYGDALHSHEEFEPIGILLVIDRYSKAISARPNRHWDDSDVRVWDLRQYF